MRNKRLLRTLSALCLTLVLASGFTVPAFAQGAAPPPAEDTTNDSNVVVEETEKAPPLTPEGNAALVDDFEGNKQLITVTTKAGNYFYILVGPVDQDIKIVACLGGNGNELLVATKIIHQRGVAIRGQRRCFFRFFHYHIAVIGGRCV